MGKSGSEVSHFIPEPRKYAEVTKLSYYIKKPWIKASPEDIKNINNNRNFPFKNPKKGEHITPCMDVYKAKIQSGGSIDKLKLRILVKGDLHNK